MKELSFDWAGFLKHILEKGPESAIKKTGKDFITMSLSDLKKRLEGTYNGMRTTRTRRTDHQQNYQAYTR